MTRGTLGYKPKKALSPFSSLAKLQFRVEYGIVGLTEKLGLDKARSKYTYLYFALLAMAFVPFTGMIFKFANVLAQAVVAIGQPGLAVIISVMAGQAVVVFIGLSHLMSSLYYSRDLELLQSLPLTPWQVMSGKILVVYVGQLLFCLAAAAPFLITLGINLGQPLYWLPALVVFLLIPAVPLALGVLLLVPIMKMTAGSRKRDLFRVLFGLVFFVLVMLFQSLNSNMVRYGPEALMAKLMEKNGLVSAAAGVYPVLKWAAWALTGEASKKALGFLLYSGFSLGFLGVVVSLSQRWFLGGVGGSHPAAKKTDKARSGVKQATFKKQSSPVFAVMSKDHKILTRTPNFVLTALLNLLIVPIVILFGFMGSGQEFMPFLEVGLGEGTRGIVLLVMLGIHGALTGLNQIASTAISREGRLFWLSKTIPVPAKIQLRAKLIYSVLFASAQLSVLVAVALIFFKFTLADLLALVVLGVLVSVPVSAICLLNDLFRPKLNWSEPQQAMKGNWQTMIAALFSWSYLAIIGVLLKFLLGMGLSYSLLYVIGGFLLAASSLLLVRWMDAAAQGQYSSLLD